MNHARPDIRYRRLFETIHIGILILNFSNRIVTDANPFIARISGYSKKELVGKKISDLKIFNEDVIGKGIFNALKKKTGVMYEDIPLIEKNGRMRIVQFSAHTYKDDGKLMVQCTIRDVTERRTAQRDLFETHQRLTALMNALPVGVAFSLDPQCDNIIANPYQSKKMGIGPADNISVTTRDRSALGKKLKHYSHGRLISAKELPMQRAIAENRVVGPLEIEVELPNGNRWLMESFGAPVRRRDGTVVGAVAVNVDLVERKKAEEAEKLKRIIEQEKLKFDFIADAAHELRTPLAIIRGNVELALTRKSLADDALEAINVEVLHLTNLLSDFSLLTTKESEFRSKKLYSRKLAISKLVERVAIRHERIAHRRNISIKIEQMPPVLIAGDAYYLERLFANIIGNAISYGKENGHIFIRGTTDAKFVNIMIRDDGIGIDTKDLPHIFDRFYRADSSRSKDYGGSGLGLAIVRWIAEAHEGRVTADSVIGKGTTFTVSLPRK